MDISKFEEKHVSTKEIYNGAVLHVIEDEITLPDNRRATRELIRHIGACCVIPVTDDLEVIMEHQYRYPIKSVVLEIPAGKLDAPDEDRLSAAKRELREETGYIADNWTDIGLYYPAPAYSDEKITMYLATGLHPGVTDLDDDEVIEIEKIPLRTLVAQVMNGEITDGKTQICVLKAAKLLLEKDGE